MEWTAFIDLEELINLKRHQTIGDLVEANAGADCIAINWRIFGGAGEEAYRPGLAMERFTRASHIDFHPNRLIKSVIRTDRVVGLSHHHALSSDAARIVAPDGALVDNRSEVEPCGSSFAVAQINHYFVRSRAEWALKVARGYTDGTVRDPGLFDTYDRNEIEDRTILRRSRLTRRWMRQLRKPERFSWRSVGTRFMARTIRATCESIHHALKIGARRARNE